MIGSMHRLVVSVIGMAGHPQMAIHRADRRPHGLCVQIPQIIGAAAANRRLDLKGCAVNAGDGALQAVHDIDIAVQPFGEAVRAFFGKNSPQGVDDFRFHPVGVADKIFLRATRAGGRRLP